MDKTKILFVDDNIKFINNIRAYLKLVAPEYEVYTTGTGEDGLRILKKEKPNIFFCDLFLLDIDGDKVIEEAKSISPSTIFIMLTAYTDEKTEVRLKAMGIKHIIYKPLEDMETVVSLIRRLSPNVNADKGHCV